MVSNEPLLTATSPPAKRQRTANGYSGRNTNAYNSDNDDGDDLLADFVPDTPGNNIYQTQPTQILDQTAAHPTSSAPATPQKLVQVPASSPFTGRDSEGPKFVSSGVNSQTHNALPRRNLGSAMAPAGTAYKPPAGIVSQPSARTVITINDDEDDGPRFLGGDSDDDVMVQSANIRPTTFTSKSAHSSFGPSPSQESPKKASGNSEFRSIVGNSVYQPAGLKPKPPRGDSMANGYGSVKKPQPQARPERAMPVAEDMTMDQVKEHLRDNVVRLRLMFPSTPILMAQNLLLMCKGSLNDAAEVIAKREETNQNAPIVIDDEEIESPQSRKPDPNFKRVLNAPAQSIRDKYSSTQAFQPRSSISSIATPPAKPKRKLMKGRRDPSSPAAAASSPLKQQSPAPAPIDLEDYETDDSGVASASEAEDPELSGRVLKYLNTCKVTDLVELTSITKEIAEIMLAARPFKTLDAARTVENTKTTKSGKKSARAPVGDRIVDTAMEMFQGYEAIDTLVARCGDLGKPLAEEMAKWGFDVFGASKSGELEMTSLEDDAESQRDSGIGSPSSAPASTNGDDDVKVAGSTRKRSTVQFLKKPDLMAEDCVLKDYQVVGLNWLALMYRHKLSCILADEMGLGKTCQVIALLSHLVETGHPGPHLVVCPGSTLENWLREFQRFAPQLAVEPYHGPQKERVEMSDQILNNRDQINVVVTTYDMAAKKEDNKFMRKLKPDVCVYDEGHMLKNVKSQRYQGLVKIPAQFRLLLTGTPLQNNLQELAALLAFILPNVFKELEDDLNYIFKAKATTSDSDHAALLSAQRIARARSMLTPFVLRRKKAQVLKHLPSKTCRVQYCSLHDSQKEVYNGHLEQARERARARLAGTKMPKTEENNPLMQLRKAAIHTQLFRRHFTDAKIEKMADLLRKKEPAYFPASSKREYLIEEMHKGSDFWLHGWCQMYPCIRSFDVPDLSWMDSGKVKAMVDLVAEYKKNGDRVLIFSQFSLVLDILEAVLSTSAVSFTRIDGSTKIEERQPLIDTFRDDESITAFLLTTKAGGTGINLMYANKVIIFDGSFNPQDDRQAENRAHRVGQIREVEVVRLVTKGTVEEQIYALGQSKLTLDGRVAGDEEGGKADEAGEKAVSRMLLEGTGMAGDDEDTKDAKTEPEVKAEVTEKKTGGRKKSSIMSMLTDAEKKESASEKKPSKPTKEEEDEEDEMLL